VLDYIFSNLYTYIYIYQHNGDASPENSLHYLLQRSVIRNNELQRRRYTYMSRRINVRVQVTVSDWISSVSDYWKEYMRAGSIVNRMNKEVDHKSTITEQETFLFRI
jgi:hypothetical protein